jgi:hypothetical protein
MEEGNQIFFYGVIWTDCIEAVRNE